MRGDMRHAWVLQREDKVDGSLNGVHESRAFDV